MANSNIELITSYSNKYWDLVYKQEAVTSVLDANPRMVKFEGAKTVKIAKFQNGGLNNYYRNNSVTGQAPAGADFVGAADFGYQKSPMRLTWEEFTLSCDRAAAFEVEYFDNEESGGELVGLGVTEISRTSIVPEVDAYCLSKIAGYALAEGTVSEDISTTPLASLNKGILYLNNKEVPNEDIVAFCSFGFLNALRNTNEVTKFLTQEDLSAGKDIKFSIEKYEGITLIGVSPERLRTEIALHDGGFGWATGSKAINFLMVPKSAVMHVVKYEKVRIISGEANLAARGFDGYTIFARIYHDVFVPDNKRVAIYLSTPATAAAAPTLKLTVEVKDGKIKSIVTDPGNTLCFVGTGDANKNVGDTLTTFTQAHVGDAITAATVFYAIDSSKKVLAKYEHKVG